MADTPALEKISNNAATTLNGAINSSVTSLLLTSAARFPTAGQFRIKIDDEIMLVTAISGVTCTVDRGVEGTTAAAHASLAGVYHMATAQAIRNLVAQGVPGIPLQPSYLKTGGQVVHTGGRNFTITAATYVILGEHLSSPATDVTLDAAHATLNRIDAFVLTAGSVGAKVTGTAAATPTEPNIAADELRLSVARMDAAQTAPTGVTTEVIYDENTEWPGTASAGTIVVNSASLPANGAVCVLGTAVATGTNVQFDKASTITLDSYDLLWFKIRNGATWPLTKLLRLAFQLNGVRKGAQVSFGAGYFGFDASVTSAYQLIAIPAIMFQVPAGQTVDELRIDVLGSGVNLTFRLDQITLQSGIDLSAPPPPAGGVPPHAPTHGVLGSDPVQLDGSQIVSGSLTSFEKTTLSGDISPTQLAANTDNWAPTGLATASVIRVSSDAARDLTGITGGADGRLLLLHNIGAFTITLKDDATSTAANRFQLNGDLPLGADESVLLQYDATSSRWRAVATSRYAKRGVLLQLCAAFTPAGTGGDTAELVVPYSPADGTTVFTYNVRRIDMRVNVAGGAPAVTIEKSTGTGAFSATSIGTQSIGSGNSESSGVGSSLGTVQSGNKVRFNVTTLGTATGWTVLVLLEQQ